MSPMSKKLQHINPSWPEAIIITALVGLGLVFMWIMFNNTIIRNHRNAMQVASSIVPALSLEKITQLDASPGDLHKPAYQELKTAFQSIIKQNKNACFAYLYVKRNGKYYFLLDSEPENSPDYSPPGQEYAEAANAYKLPFVDGRSRITPPLTDRWGTWVSVLVPVTNGPTGKVVAVFAMDISTRDWNRRIFQEAAKSSALVVLLILSGLLLMRFMARNRLLVNEIAERSQVEKALAESEERYRLLYENSSIGIYQTTPDGKVLLSNQALLNILDYKSFDELKQKDIEKGEFDPVYERSVFKEIMEKEGAIFGLENVWKRQDGRMVYIRENAKAVRDEQGKILYYDGTIEDITERVMAEKALRYSEERFRQIAEQSREVVWEVDTTGLYTYISPLSSSVLGYLPGELVNKKHVFDLLTDDSREEFRMVTMDFFGRKESFHDFIRQTVKGNGERIWVMTNAVPIVDEKGILTGYRGADSDITERIQRESLLNKLTQAVEQSPVSIVITSIDGTIEYGNPKSCQTTGYSLDELSGQNPRILKSAFKPSSAYSELWETITAGKVWQGEFLNKRKNGELYWEAASISPIFDNKGNIINFLAVKEDITPIKKLISELQDAKDRAESSDLLKSAFIKNISHEIRTPLNGIVGMSEQLLQTSLPPPLKEQLQSLIKDSSARLINTVDSYLDISMIVSGNVVVQVQPFSLGQLLNDIKTVIHPACISRNLVLRLQLPAEPENRMVKSDSELLTKILMHLLGNAIKFTETGTITFGYETNGDLLALFVKDSGIGIEKSFLPHIFETFTQADVSDTRAYEGSGLGLAIAYRLARLLSGEIRAESEKLVGSTFYLTFRLNDLFGQPE